MKTNKLKSIQAFFMGYVYFKVKTTRQTKIFYTYHQARDYRLQVKGRIEFIGFNVFLFVRDYLSLVMSQKIIKVSSQGLGIRCFYLKI